jgi:hypothetical protein
MVRVDAPPRHMKARPIGTIGHKRPPGAATAVAPTKHPPRDREPPKPRRPMGR